MFKIYNKNLVLIIILVILFFFIFHKLNIDTSKKDYIDYKNIEKFSKENKIIFQKGKINYLNGKKDNLSFIFTGHIYNNYDDFEYLINKSIKEEKFLIIGGDLREQGFNILSKYINENDIFFLTPGNHEILDRKSEINYINLFGDYKNYQIGENIIIILNTNKIQSKKFQHGSGNLSLDQIKFLKKSISKNFDKKILIFMHHALWSFDLNEAQLIKMYDNEGINIKKNIQDIQFPSNDTNKNNWMHEIHKILKKHNNVYVFSGDASLSSRIEIDGVKYFASGLGSSNKGNWLGKDKESYINCNENAKKIKCKITYFKSK